MSFGDWIVTQWNNFLDYNLTLMIILWVLSLVLAIIIGVACGCITCGPCICFQYSRIFKWRKSYKDLRIKTSNKIEKENEDTLDIADIENEFRHSFNDTQIKNDIRNSLNTNGNRKSNIFSSIVNKDSPKNSRSSISTNSFKNMRGRSMEIEIENIFNMFLEYKFEGNQNDFFDFLTNIETYPVDSVYKELKNLELFEFVNLYDDEASPSNIKKKIKVEKAQFQDSLDTFYKMITNQNGRVGLWRSMLSILDQNKKSKINLNNMNSNENLNSQSLIDPNSINFQPLENQQSDLFKKLESIIVLQKRELLFDRLKASIKLSDYSSIYNEKIESANKGAITCISVQNFEDLLMDKSIYNASAINTSIIMYFEVLRHRVFTLNGKFLHFNENLVILYFATESDAFQFSVLIQHDLLMVPWPINLLHLSNSTRIVIEKESKSIIFRGLRAKVFVDTLRLQSLNELIEYTDDIIKEVIFGGDVVISDEQWLSLCNLDFFSEEWRKENYKVSKLEITKKSLFKHPLFLINDSNKKENSEETILDNTIISTMWLVYPKALKSRTILRPENNTVKKKSNYLSRNSLELKLTEKQKNKELFQRLKDILIDSDIRKFKDQNQQTEELFKIDTSMIEREIQLLNIQINSYKSIEEKLSSISFSIAPSQFEDDQKSLDSSIIPDQSSFTKLSNLSPHQLRLSENQVLYFTQVSIPNIRNIWRTCFQLGKSDLLSIDIQKYFNCITELSIENNVVNMWTREDSFYCCFLQLVDAIRFILKIQLVLLEISWNNELLEYIPDMKIIFQNENILFNGLRARSAIISQKIRNSNWLSKENNINTFDDSILQKVRSDLQEIISYGIGGETVITNNIWNQIIHQDVESFLDFGLFPMREEEGEVWFIVPDSLSSRFDNLASSTVTVIENELTLIEMKNILEKELNYQVEQFTIQNNKIKESIRDTLPEIDLLIKQQDLELNNLKSEKLSILEEFDKLKSESDRLKEQNKELLSIIESKKLFNIEDKHKNTNDEISSIENDSRKESALWLTNREQNDFEIQSNSSLSIHPSNKDQELMMTIESLSKENNYLQEQLSLNNVGTGVNIDDVSKLEEEWMFIQNQNQTLIETLEQERKSNAKILEESHKEIYYLNQECQRLKDALNTQLQKEEQSITSFKRQIADIPERHSFDEHNNFKFRNQSSTFEPLSQIPRGNGLSTIQTLESKNKLLVSTIKDLEEELQTLKRFLSQQLEDHEIERQKLETELQEISTDQLNKSAFNEGVNITLIQENLQLKEYNLQLLSNMDSLKNEIATLKSKKEFLAETAIEISKLDAEVKALQEANRKLTSQNTLLREGLSVSNIQFAEKSKSFEEKQKSLLFDIDKLTSKNYTLTLEILQLQENEKKISTLEEIIESLKQEIEVLKLDHTSYSSKLQSGLKQSESEIDRLKKILQDSYSQLNNKRIENEALLLKIAEMENEIITILSGTEQSNNEFKEIISSLESSNAKLVDQVNILKRQLDDTLQKEDKVQAENRIQIQKDESAIKELNNTKSDTASKLRSLEDKNKILSDQNGELSRIIKIFELNENEMKDQLTQRVNQLLKENEILLRKNNQLKNKNLNILKENNLDLQSSQRKSLSFIEIEEKNDSLDSFGVESPIFSKSNLHHKPLATLQKHSFHSRKHSLNNLPILSRSNSLISDKSFNSLAPISVQWNVYLVHLKELSNYLNQNKLDRTNLNLSQFGSLVFASDEFDYVKESGLKIHSCDEWLYNYFVNLNQAPVHPLINHGISIFHPTMLPFKKSQKHNVTLKENQISVYKWWSILESQADDWDSIIRNERLKILKNSKILSSMKESSFLYEIGINELANIISFLNEKDLRQLSAVSKSFYKTISSYIDICCVGNLEPFDENESKQWNVGRYTLEFDME